MNEMHYLKKIERNANVLDKAPDNLKPSVLEHIVWAKELSKRLENLDYDVRDQAIMQIHEVLDNDYEAMGFSKEEEPKQKSM